MVTRFNHPCVLVKDMKRSLRFYEGTLGLEAVRKRTAEGKCPETIYNIKGLKIDYVKLRARRDPKNMNGLLELHHWRNPKMLPGKTYNHISFSVENLDKEYRRLKKRGVKFVSRPVIAPHGQSKLCFCNDPDGNLIEFSEDLAK